MDFLFGHLDFVIHFIDDCAIRTQKEPGMTDEDCFRVHLSQIATVLEILEKHGFQINARKCTFATTSAEYLGFKVSRQGVSPVNKKVEAILALKEPTTRRQVRSFLGFLQYYRDMYRLRSHILAPLTALTSSKTKFKWTPECQTAFERIKQEAAKRIMLAYPDFNQKFKVYTDASNLQLGSVITQGGRPIAFFSRKLTGAQTRYTVTEKELLLIVETLKAYKSILYGMNVTVYTDHQNLIYKVSESERVNRWRLLIEEFGISIEYIKGKANVIADFMSRWPKLESATHEVQMTQNERRFTAFPLHFPDLLWEQEKSTTTTDKGHKLTDCDGTTLRTYEGNILIPSKLK